MNLRFPLDGTHQDVTLGDGTASVGGSDTAFTWTEVGPGTFRLRLGHVLHTVDSIQVEGDRVRFRLDGRNWDLPFQDEQAQLLARLGFKSASAGSSGQVKAPMPGRILSLAVAVGDVVAAQQPLAVLEAMKMENELRSPIAGRIRAVHVETGRSVEKNTLLMEIEPLG